MAPTILELQEKSMDPIYAFPKILIYANEAIDFA
jgi:hypothetical protein